MFPSLMMWHPSLARSLIKYRNDRVGEAKEKALSCHKGYVGAMFPWESGFTGAEVCPSWASTGQLEQHITGMLLHISVYVQSMFSLCSVYVQSMFSLCSV